MISPPPATAGGGEHRWWRAGALADRVTQGVGARLMVAAPHTAEGEHSLAELSAESGFLHRNLVEVGWRVAPRTLGDARPHLFVFHWVHGTPRCYDGCGFVPTGGWAIPGRDLSTNVGRLLYLGMVAVEGTWWVWLEDGWVGSFPASEWDGNFIQATTVQWFGEVWSRSDPARSAMGTGERAGRPGAALFRDLCTVDLASWTCRPTDAELRMTAPALYDARLDADRVLSFGGPGALAELTPPPPPSSASAGTPAATGTSGPSRPR
ncbi:MAG TPA: neprosin family prolyl endopeptidase [Myxococcaceae bacterium]|nr:neprosin family prolyl endopeptidase [Myxococcaceae bacterium]